MQVGTLEITLLANMARLQSDMDKAKRSVGDAVTKMNQILGTIGVGISVAGFSSLIKSVVDVGDKFNDLKKITGLTIEQLAGIDKAAALNGTNLDQVAKAVGIMSKNMVAGSAGLQTIGISSRQVNGDFRSTGEVLLDVADRFSRMRDGVQKAALAQDIFGKSGRELIPLLNEGRASLQSQIETYGAASGMTTRLAEESDKFNDILTLLGSRVTAVKNSFVAELLPTLNNIGTAMLSTGSATNQFSFAAQVVVPVLKGLAIAGFTVVDTFRGMGREIGARAAQLAAFASMDLKGAKFIGTALAEDNAKSRAEYDKFVDTVLNGEKQIAQSIGSGGTKEILKLQELLPPKIDAATKAKEKQIKQYDIEIYKLKQYDAEARRARDITDSVATEQEIYNKKLDELNRLKPYLTIETYDRALAKLNDTNKNVAVSTQKTTDEVSQLWIQAGRNIQSSLGNLVFDFFNGGLKDMVRNAGNAVLRIMSEFAGLRMAQGLGLAGMFTAGGASASTGAAGASELLNMASLGTSAMSLFKGGFGSMGLLSSVGGMLPGQAGAFMSGMGGGTVAGVSSSASLMGSSFAAVAGPAVALFAVDAIGRLLAGDKKLGGAEMIPVVGGFLAALFGRGPMKFRQQSLQGTASGEGFEGDITNVFRAKGGLFRSNGHKSVTEQLSLEMQTMLDGTINGFYDSASSFAKNLGLSADLVDNFTAQVQIKSEKGKTLTEEAIADMLKGIGNSLAQNVLPMVDTLRKAGEDSFATLTRLNTEFVSLTSAVQNLGASAGYAKELVKEMSFEQRTALVDLAGGTEQLGNLTSFFFQNFLSDSEQLDLKLEQTTNALADLGLSADLTKDQFKALVQSVGTANDLRIELLKLAPAFLEVRNAAAATNMTIGKSAADLLGDAFADLSKSVDAERKKVTDQYNRALETVDKRIQGITDSISKLRSLSDALKNTVEELRPLSRDQAKFQILSAINKAKLGDGLPEAGDISQALNTLKSSSITGVRSSFELAREQAKTANLVADLGDLTNTQLSVEEKSLVELQNHRFILQNNYDDEITRLDRLIAEAQKQVNATSGLSDSILKLSIAIEQFNLRSQQAGGASIGGLGTGGNPGISDQEIRDFLKTPGLSDMDIYNAAKRYGVSFAQYAAATGKNLDDLYAWADKNKLPKFANGGMHRGGLRIVGERGPELERTGPSHITSNNNLKESIGNDEVVKELKSVRQELRELNKIFSAVTQGGTLLRTKNIA